MAAWGWAVMRVVGIDPSLTGTGLCADGECATVTTKPEQPMGERLALIYAAVGGCADGSPWLAVMEDMPAHAKSAGLTAMAHGVVRLALHHAGAHVLTVPPATLKKYATGKGAATKADMRMALYQRVGIDLRDDNQVDAWWLRALGHQMLGAPVVGLPKAHVAALDKLRLPGGES